MNETLAKLREQFKNIWQNTSSTQKLIFGFVSMLLLIAIGYSIFTANQTDYQPLWTDMDTSDAGAVQAKLEEMKVPFQLANGGKTILVPSDQVDSTRLTLANQNLPTGGVVGFELFDQTNFGETDTDRKTKYQRALQGELTKTIRQMQEVKNARVHIVIPDEALFQEQQQNATASVMLELKPYQKLTEEQVAGLVRMVSNSVQGLKPENVTIVDSNMVNLTENIALDDNSKTGSSKLTSKQLEIQDQVQKDLEKAAQSMLDQVMPGKAVVRVSAQLNFDQIESTNEQYGDNVVRSQQVTDESTTSQSSSSTGIPGTTSNVSTPTYQTVNPQTGSSTSTKTGKTTNYEVSKNQEHTVVAPGGIKKLSVAVLVNGGNISPTQQTAITNAVSNAVGLVQGRDQVSVSAIPFDTSNYDQLKLQMEQEAQQQRYIIYGVIAAVLLIGLGIGFVLFARKRKAEQLTTPEGVVANDVLTVEELIRPEPEESPEDKEKEQMRQEVENLARQNPGNIAQLLKTWLSEE